MSSEADYWVGPTIGEGAFGHVVYGVHKETNREVAIKVMEVSSQGNRQDLQKQKTQMILNERRILSLPDIKDSRWVVDLWAAFCGRAWACSSSLQSLYFVMKLANGGDLAGLIRRGLLPTNRKSWIQDSVEWYAFQLIRAVDFLHSKGIVHCDLKPENLLLDAATGHLTLADFGSALDTNQPQDQLTLRGTASYACPEILRAVSPSELTVAVDHWSVGCILYAMRHGRSPFDRGSEALTVEAIVQYADSGGSEKAWIEVCRGAVDEENEETESPDETELDHHGPLQSLSRDLLAALPNDRISVWKDKALPLLSLPLNDSDSKEGDCPESVLLPVPEWQQVVNNFTMKDGNAGWVAYQL